MRAKTTIRISLLVVLMSLLPGCGGLQPAANEPLQDQQPSESMPAENVDLQTLATPVADRPAAGICAEFEGERVTVTVFPDIPDPRCSLIRPEQVLEVVNAREETLVVTIGAFQAELPPGESHLFERPFGEYLAPGVHRIEVQPCCGAELWLQGQ